MDKGVLCKSEILKQLSCLAVDENVAANYRIKALELLGKEKGMFGEKDAPLLGTVKIVDDIK
jgi:hypothetical protein